jgi:hypothetical protein
MGDDLVFVLEFHPEGGVGEQFGDHSREFEHFFFRHKAPSASKFGGEWSGRAAKSRTIPGCCRSFVMPGLDPGIHVVGRSTSIRHSGVSRNPG